MKLIICIFLVWNIITFAMMGIDKYKAEHHMWRIIEAALLGSAFLMGAAGSFAGSKFFHHKTLKTKFRIGLPAALIVNIVAVCVACWYIPQVQAVMIF